MEEIWKDIPDYEGLYQISNLGRVKNIRGKILKSEYRQVSLCKNGKVKQFSKYKLVAITFLGFKYKDGSLKKCIIHKDGDPLNNRLDNLDFSKHSDVSTIKLPKTNKVNRTRYTGVQPFGKKYKAQISINGKCKYLGSFKTPELAAKAYEKAKEEERNLKTPSFIIKTKKEVEEDLEKSKKKNETKISNTSLLIAIIIMAICFAIHLLWK